ncbi:MAG: HD domain-containing protein [Candidatus Nealsonbacteria bacterium]|nr:HD domain-containing protein [Candidatus Nealsonbacteria bacterium]
MEIPSEVKRVIKKLEQNGFEAFIVGGCVRDLLRGAEPKDWDVATDAKPEQVQKIFPNSFYKNRFFTVTVQTESEDSKLKEIEITTFRLEMKYTDKRHPSQIEFAKNIQDDLARRDFTVNAMAMNKEKKIIDPFEGKKDLKKKLIRAVREPEKRFSEDALRMMRAARFVVQLGKSWKVESRTEKAIKQNAKWLEIISKERIRDELLKIIMTKRAAEGIELLRKLKLLEYIIPELEEAYGVAQNKHHVYGCYEHAVRSLRYAAQQDFNIYVRLASLLHDIGKPATKRGKGEEATFYGHEVVGAKMARKILERLKLPRKDIQKIVKLVRYHLFYYHPDEVSESSVRRLVRKVGKENMDELIQVRMADRIGSGVPKAEPYKLRHLRYVIEKVSQDPISTKMLKVDGNDVMKILDIKEGPMIGQILDVLLGEVLSDPQKNKKEILKKEVRKLGSLPQERLASIAKEAKKERNKIETKRDRMTKKKYWVS